MRSYSSLVSSMLGQHSGLYCLPEVNPFIEATLGANVDILQLVRKRTLDGLYRAIAELEFGEQTDATIALARKWVGARRSWTAIQLMGHLAAAVAPRRLIEKSPSTVLAKERLDQAISLFPDACFLHLYRHPISASASIAKITNHGQPGQSRQAKDPEDSWFNTNAAIISAASRIPPAQFLSARGEDILGDPDNYLGQICDWLELPTTSADFAAMRKPELSPYASLGPSTAPFGNDPGFLKHPQYSQREIVLAPLSSPLEWAKGARRLKPETIALSYQLGYC